MLFENNDGSLSIKLTDFGWASQNFDKRQTICGTPECNNLYSFLDLAPEMVKNEPYDSKIDIWSLGVIIYEMITGCSPFTGNSIEEQIKTYSNFDTIKFKLEESNASQELQNLLCLILQPDPLKRITIFEVLNNKWF